MPLRADSRRSVCEKVIPKAAVRFIWNPRKAQQVG